MAFSLRLLYLELDCVCYLHNVVATRALSSLPSWLEFKLCLQFQWQHCKCLSYLLPAIALKSAANLVPLDLFILAGSISYRFLCEVFCASSCTLGQWSGDFLPSDQMSAVRVDWNVFEWSRTRSLSWIAFGLFSELIAPPCFQWRLTDCAFLFFAIRGARTLGSCGLIASLPRHSWYRFSSRLTVYWGECR